MTISVILIPYDESKPLENPLVSWDEDHAKNFQNTICELLDETDFLETPLMRPRGNNVAGLYAYYNNNNNTQNENTSSDNHNNIRATRLAMACGLLPKRFQGRVLIVRSFGGTWQDLTIDEIVGACCVSMDLRSSIQMELGKSNGIPPPPTWLADAAQHNYHDGAALAQVATAMNMESKDDDDDDDEDDSSNIVTKKKKTVQRQNTTRHVKNQQQPLLSLHQKNSLQRYPYACIVEDHRLAYAKVVTGLIFVNFHAVVGPSDGPMIVFAQHGNCTTHTVTIFLHSRIIVSETGKLD